MKVRLISATYPPRSMLANEVTPEDLIVYTARVSSPANQDNFDTAPKLLRYLIRHGHWSPFEMVDMTLEIETSRAIAAQILRHRSFSFQEFSQRYADPTELGTEVYEARRQDERNRQNSIDDLPEDVREGFRLRQADVACAAETNYEWAISQGIAKECARFLLPLSTQTRLYMKGSVRSWIHYFQVRCALETQKEHRDVALAARAIFDDLFPYVAEALKELES